MAEKTWLLVAGTRNCDCLASTLRKGGGEEGEKEEMGSDVRMLHLKA